MSLIQSLWTDVSGGTIRRSIGAIFLPAQHFCLFLGDQRTVCCSLSLLRLFHGSYVVLLLLQFSKLLLVLCNIRAADSHRLKPLL